MPPQLHWALLHILVAARVCKPVYGKACLLCWWPMYAARVKHELDHSIHPNGFASC